MTSVRHARVFRNGRNQAVRIPREFEFEVEDVIIRKQGNRLILEPAHKMGLLSVLSKLDPVEDEFPDIDSDLGELDDVSLGGHA